VISGENQCSESVPKYSYGSGNFELPVLIWIRRAKKLRILILLLLLLFNHLPPDITSGQGLKNNFRFFFTKYTKNIYYIDTMKRKNRQTDSKKSWSEAA
jgi:hypothetical protein